MMEQFIKLLTQYRKAVALQAFKGAQDPDDYEHIDNIYNEALINIVKYVDGLLKEAGYKPSN